MKDLFTVVSFTAKEMVNRKSFIISTLIILLLIVIGFNIPNIIDQTTPNMIQGLKGIFARKPLISRGI